MQKIIPIENIKSVLFENGTSQNTSRSQVKTTLRNDVWAVQKQEGKRWGLVVGDNGPQIYNTRGNARAVTRELRNLDRTIKVRVVRLAPVDKT